MTKHCSTIMIFVFLSEAAMASGSIRDDMTFIQESYKKVETLKCNVAIEYFSDYESDKKDYGLNAELIINNNTYYSKMGNVEMIITSTRGLMIDHSKKFALLSDPEKVKTKSKNPITMSDI